MDNVHAGSPPNQLCAINCVWKDEHDGSRGVRAGPQAVTFDKEYTIWQANASCVQSTCKEIVCTAKMVYKIPPWTVKGLAAKYHVKNKLIKELVFSLSPSIPVWLLSTNHVILNKMRKSGCLSGIGYILEKQQTMMHHLKVWNGHEIFIRTKLIIR